MRAQQRTEIREQSHTDTRKMRHTDTDCLDHDDDDIGGVTKASMEAKRRGVKLAAAENEGKIGNERKRERLRATAECNQEQREPRRSRSGWFGQAFWLRFGFALASLWLRWTLAPLHWLLLPPVRIDAGVLTRRKRLCWSCSSPSFLERKLPSPSLALLAMGGLVWARSSRPQGHGA